MCKEWLVEKRTLFPEGRHDMTRRWQPKKDSHRFFFFGKVVAGGRADVAVDLTVVRQLQDIWRWETPKDSETWLGHLVGHKSPSRMVVRVAAQTRPVVTAVASPPPLSYLSPIMLLYLCFLYMLYILAQALFFFAHVTAVPLVLVLILTPVYP